MNEKDPTLQYTVTKPAFEEPKPQPKLCPMLAMLMKTWERYNCTCQGEGCAWWTGEKCAVLAIAENTEPTGLEEINASVRIWGSGE